MDLVDETDVLFNGVEPIVYIKRFFTKSGEGVTVGVSLVEGEFALVVDHDQGQMNHVISLASTLMDSSLCIQSYAFSAISLIQTIERLPLKSHEGSSNLTEDSKDPGLVLTRPVRLDLLSENYMSLLTSFNVSIAPRIDTSLDTTSLVNALDTPRRSGVQQHSHECSQREVTFRIPCQVPTYWVFFSNHTFSVSTSVAPNVLRTARFLTQTLHTL
jgi:hypothetical protein